MPGNDNRARYRTFWRSGIAAWIKRKPLTALALSGGACVLLLALVLVAVIISLTGLGSELKARGDKIDLLKMSLGELTEDYNALRRSLGLEPREFALEEPGGTAAAGAPSGLAQGLSIIQSRYYDELKARRFTEFKTGAAFTTLAAAVGCRPVDTGLFSMALVRKNDIYFSLAYAPETGEVTVTAAGQPDRHSGPWDDRAAAFISGELKKVETYYATLPARKAALAALAKDGKSAAVLADKGLILKPGGEDAHRFWFVAAREREDLLTLAFDKLEAVWLIDERRLPSGADPAAAALDAIRSLDARTAKEKRLAAVAASLESELAAPAFLAACAEAGMTAATKPRETETALYYDVAHRGVKIGAFAVMKDTADIYFVDQDDVQIQALRTVAGAPGAGPLSLGDRSRTGDVTTFLILGQNEENADTTILLQADERTRSLAMLSLPRDLFYRGARINRLPQAGFDHCAAKISELTGVAVSRYAAVDIYSLVSLIDLLGGIDVELRRDLIDPTYRIKDNGVWQTLAYPRGRHHLSGVQALRVIRSRATSSDFDRSRRQQLVLEALFTRLKTACGRNLDTAVAVFSRLKDFVRTDLSPLETARYFFMYKDFRISGRYVLDTSNILRQTYSMLYSLPEEEQEARMLTDKVEDLGAYILLPRNNDWDLFRSYVRTLLASR